MARQKLVLTVIVAPGAITELEEIWHYNAEHRSVTAADAYLKFLYRHIFGLSQNYDRGRVVEDHPDLRRISCRTRTRGFGHVVIYRIDDLERTVRILHVYHDAQDVQGRISAEFS
jgi:plasmid stabilization system protein ParE